MVVFSSCGIVVYHPDIVGLVRVTFQEKIFAHVHFSVEVACFSYI